MKIEFQQRDSGIALIMVMVAVFVLSVLVGAFAYSMKVETRLAQNSNNEENLIWLGYSGVQQAESILAQANCPYEALNQKWAGGIGSECETNGAFTDLPMENIPVGDGKISIKITDLERKININTASDQLIQQALTSIGVDASEASAVVDGILDWTDPNPNSNVHRPNGAKSDYYQTLDPPYYAKNGAIDDLSELLLVRGISQDLYWGPASTNHFGAYFQARDQHGRFIQQPAYTAGLVDIFTTMGGKVNINTASATVLQAIPGIDQNMADEIIQMREQAPFADLSFVPGNRGALNQYCDVHSYTFEVEVQAEIGGTRGTFNSVIARTGAKNFQIVSFYWK